MNKRFEVVDDDDMRIDLPNPERKCCRNTQIISVTSSIQTILQTLMLAAFVVFVFEIWGLYANVYQVVINAEELTDIAVKFLQHGNITFYIWNVTVIIKSGLSA